MTRTGENVLIGVGIASVLSCMVLVGSYLTPVAAASA